MDQSNNETPPELLKYEPRIIEGLVKNQLERNIISDYVTLIPIKILFDLCEKTNRFNILMDLALRGMLNLVFWGFNTSPWLDWIDKNYNKKSYKIVNASLEEKKLMFKLRVDMNSKNKKGQAIIFEMMDRLAHCNPRDELVGQIDFMMTVVDMSIKNLDGKQADEYSYCAKCKTYNTNGLDRICKTLCRKCGKYSSLVL